MRGEWVGWMGRMDRMRWDKMRKVEEKIDRKVTLVALRSFFVWGFGIVNWGLGFRFF